MTNARTWSRAKRIGRRTSGFMAAGVVMNVSMQAWALDATPPPTVPMQKAPPPAKEPNSATLRPVAIRVEAMTSLYTWYGFGVTAGYAFHPRFALEGSAGWEGEGFSFGGMARLRFPVTGATSISAGVGGTLLWLPWRTGWNWRGTYAWLPAEIGWEYRSPSGFTFFAAASARVLVYSRRIPPDFPLCILCLGPAPQVFPAARLGVGWAF